MRLRDDLLIGYPDKFAFERFSNTDHGKKFIDSLRKNGPDWEYRTVEVSYIRNSFGHRSKELSDVDFTNYILCIGCSFTEGIGIPAENRYSDVLAKMLNTDVYNLGLSGSGNDTIIYNFSSWLNKINKTPKLVILQWSDDNRFLRYFNKSKFELVCAGIWSPGQKNFVVEGELNSFFDARTYFLKRLARQLTDVPILEIPWNSTESNDYEIQFLAVDKARDLEHPGIASNKLLAENIVERVKKLKLLTT